MEFKTNTVDLNQQTIKNIFFEQVKKLSVGKTDSFGMQFSDSWV